MSEARRQTASLARRRAHLRTIRRARLPPLSWQLLSPQGVVLVVWLHTTTVMQGRCELHGDGLAFVPQHRTQLPLPLPPSGATAPINIHESTAELRLEREHKIGARLSQTLCRCVLLCVAAAAVVVLCVEWSLFWFLFVFVFVVLLCVVVWCVLCVVWCCVWCCCLLLLCAVVVLLFLLLLSVVAVCCCCVVLCVVCCCCCVVLLSVANALEPMLESCSTSTVWVQDQATVSFVWIRDRTGVNLCTTVEKQTLCTSLSPCGRHGIDCHTHESTVPRLKCTRVLQLHSVFVKDTTLLKLRLKLFQADSFPQRLRVCFSLCLSWDLCLSAGCCCYWWSCRMLLHLVSSSPSPNVQFCHSSCTC